ncbi:MULTISPECIES: DUF7535 family protein [Haloarcula]|uniref:DUF7535 family protein n=1 Tax=Haloarcula TaxID=2237 RepID=UPI0023EBB15A|nr:hypothetical protein [Halomicroarcula sp. XH51]
MAENEPSNDSILPEPIRSVTPLTGTRPNQSMDVIGWGIFLGLVLLLVPLLPFIIVVWLISKLVEALTPS